MLEKRKPSKPRAEERRSYRIRHMPVAKVMTRSVVTVTEDTSVKELKRLFEKHDFNSFPVVENGELTGIVTKLDFMRAFSMGVQFRMSRFFDLYAKRVGDIMRRATVSLRPDDTIERAVEYMVEFGLRSLPVVEGRKLVGIVSRGDLMDHLLIEDE